MLGIALAAAPAAAGPGDHVLPLPPAQTPAAQSGVAEMRTACEHQLPSCDPYVLLSALERRAVERALAERGLTPDHAPAGKRIGKMLFAQFKVFGPGDGFLQWFNHFHWTTRSDTVKRELEFVPGDPWNQSKVDETARRLRDPVSTSLVAIVPVQSADRDAVDVLVVTRDVWSIRFNSSYEFQQGRFTLLNFSLSENNLLGWRKLLSANFRMDQATYFVGPIYIDHNMFGKHLELVERAGPVFNRHTLKLEGSESTVTFGRPLWSLDTRWGATIDWTHHFEIDRLFKGFDPATYLGQPWEYRERRMTATATVTRGWSGELAKRVNGGLQVVSERPTLLPSFPDDPLLRSAFASHVLPRSERTSALFVGGQLFETRYRNYQNVSSFELAEDTQMGATADASVAVGMKLLGSETNFVKLSGTLGYTGALGDDGLWKLSLSGTTRLEHGHASGIATDDVVEADARIVSPTYGPGRLVSETVWSGVFHDTQNQLYTLGGDNGLRAYPIGWFQGKRRAIWQTELRTRPMSILFTRWGLVAFHDLGGAASSFKSMPFFEDVGLGVRALVPQLEADVFRFDVAVALRSDPLCHMDHRATCAGDVRFTAGYLQSF